MLLVDVPHGIGRINFTFVFTSSSAVPTPTLFSTGAAFPLGAVLTQHSGLINFDLWVFRTFREDPDGNPTGQVGLRLYVGCQCTAIVQIRATVLPPAAINCVNTVPAVKVVLAVPAP
jgi:hypothetical protein